MESLFAQTIPLNYPLFLESCSFRNHGWFSHLRGIATLHSLDLFGVAGAVNVHDQQIAHSIQILHIHFTVGSHFTNFTNLTNMHLETFSWFVQI